ncbi:MULTISPECIES: hypothetical protein [Legionella]|uniref:hypothetical protein n=1 Tax=Legionella TaxID=445 RepID=UPI000969C5C6|nr:MULTISPECIES: hypothetical protein [Legionella]MBN9228553.1 hypothetical protein [Legionella steelei]OJW08064.1 MAG: hypothetical protein BGO44_12245 [Legionella sp. 39-23]
MRNSKQQKQSPLDELANEMILAVLNARNKDESYIIEPKDMASVALSSRRLNMLSQNANCIFFPHMYKNVREKASDYHDYKEKRLGQLQYEQRMRNEKSAPFYLNKAARKTMACGFSLLLASFLAFKFEMSYPGFFLTTVVFTLLSMVINEFLHHHVECTLDKSKLREIPLEFFEEEIASKTTSFSL